MENIYSAATVKEFENDSSALLKERLEEESAKLIKALDN
jgi:hypothetical protein